MTVLVELNDGYTLLRLNRPQVLNAVNAQMLRELAEALTAIDADDSQHAIIIAGNDKSFAAGADVAEINAQTFPEAYVHDFLHGWDAIGRARKPRIAAVEGLALGGGCELTMLCDVVLAGENASFGQPEVKLGLMPGAGGTQRLSRRIGPAAAADWCLSGRRVPASEAGGLVSRVVDAGAAEPEARIVAEALAKSPLPSVLALTEALRAAEELPLSQGVRLERRLFQYIVGSDGAKAGTATFLKKSK